jgi:hypothetical protein
MTNPQTTSLTFPQNAELKVVIFVFQFEKKETSPASGGAITSTRYRKVNGQVLKGQSHKSIFLTTEELSQYRMCAACCDTDRVFFSSFLLIP